MRLTIEIPEEFVNATNEFLSPKTVTIQLEHSLLSISKWESRWRQSFFKTETKTREQTIDYVRCMTIDRNVDQRAYRYITDAQISKINQYVNMNMTATTVRNDQSKKSRRIITSEVVYYWMIEQGIPFECQKWHFSRLMTLINVCAAERNPPKKRNPKELAEYHRRLNASRKAKHHTKG